MKFDFWASVDRQGLGLAHLRVKSLPCFSFLFFFSFKYISIMAFVSEFTYMYFLCSRGAPWRCGVLTTHGGIAAIGSGHLLGSVVVVAVGGIGGVGGQCLCRYLLHTPGRPRHSSPSRRTAGEPHERQPRSASAPRQGCQRPRQSTATATPTVYCAVSSIGTGRCTTTCASATYPKNCTCGASTYSAQPYPNTNACFLARKKHRAPGPHRRIRIPTRASIDGVGAVGVRGVRGIRGVGVFVGGVGSNAILDDRVPPVGAPNSGVEVTELSLERHPFPAIAATKGCVKSTFTWKVCENKHFPGVVSQRYHIFLESLGNPDTESRVHRYVVIKATVD